VSRSTVEIRNASWLYLRALDLETAAGRRPALLASGQIKTLPVFHFPIFYEMFQT